MEFRLVSREISTRCETHCRGAVERFKVLKVYKQLLSVCHVLLDQSVGKVQHLISLVIFMNLVFVCDGTCACN
jgi:hypothetical protein